MSMSVERRGEKNWEHRLVEKRLTNEGCWVKRIGGKIWMLRRKSEDKYDKRLGGEMWRL